MGLVSNLRGEMPHLFLALIQQTARGLARGQHGGSHAWFRSLACASEKDSVDEAVKPSGSGRCCAGRLAAAHRPGTASTTMLGGLISLGALLDVRVAGVGEDQMDTTDMDTDAMAS